MGHVVKFCKEIRLKPLICRDFEPKLGSVEPKILEPVWGQLGVANSVLNILVSQISLNSSSVMTMRCQIKPTGMASVADW